MRWWWHFVVLKCYFFYLATLLLSLIFYVSSPSPSFKLKQQLKTSRSDPMPSMSTPTRPRPSATTAGRCYGDSSARASNAKVWREHFCNEHFFFCYFLIRFAVSFFPCVVSSFSSHPHCPAICTCDWWKSPTFCLILTSLCFQDAA